MTLTVSMVGKRIRQLRRQRGLALTEVAARAGYSKGFLSKIECGNSSPPIATLLRLAAALDADPAYLLQSARRLSPLGQNAVHIRPRDRTPVRNASTEAGYTYLALAAQRGNKRMEPFLLKVNPGEIDPTRRFEHPGEEFIYVLEGEMDYRVGEQNFFLQAGDSLYFDGMVPHIPLPRKSTVTFLAIFSAPKRRCPPGKRKPQGRRNRAAK